MTSKNGSQELVSLLQYMKETNIENPNITVKDSRILELDRIVNEVKASEEWEAMKMNILEIGIEKGISQGDARRLVASVENVAANLNVSIEKACEIVGTSVEAFEKAKTIA